MARAGAGRRWLDGLPEVVADLAARWELEIGDPMPGGTAALVVAARDGSGRDCALKVAMALDANDAELFRRSVLVHEVAAGRGCAELFRHDAKSSAMLLERLGPNLHDLSMPVPAVLETVTTTLRSFWRPLPDDCGLPTEADQSRWLAGSIAKTWAELGRPCPRGVVDRALEYCEERANAFEPAAAVLVHGDAHGWNTLTTRDGICKFVDPEGLRSSRAHDLSVPMREYNAPLLAGDTPRLVRERAELLSSWAEVDPEPVWQWGFIERVSTGLANVRDFEGDDGLAFLEVAARCL
jgi:streptomycin 6-kinase